jgi:hypothetical protein
MLVCSLVAQLGFLLGALFVSAVWTVLKRSALQGALLLYGLSIGWILLFSVMIPSVLLLLGVDKQVVLESFPEEIGITPVVLAGWVPASIFAVLVRAVHGIIEVIRGHPSAKSGKRRWPHIFW